MSCLLTYLNYNFSVFIAAFLCFMRTLKLQDYTVEFNIGCNVITQSIRNVVFLWEKY